MLLPRLIRLKDAPKYLGMDRHGFNHDVRPYVTELRLGKQGVAFDRDDLDNWVKALKENIEQRHRPYQGNGNVLLKKPLPYNRQSKTTRRLAQKGTFK